MLIKRMPSLYPDENYAKGGVVNGVKNESESKNSYQLEWTLIPFSRV